MKLLYITTYVPWPLGSGGNQAFFVMADYVRKHHDLSVLLYAHSSKERKNIEELKKIWSDVTFYVYDPSIPQKDLQEVDDLVLPPTATLKDKLTYKFFDFLYRSMSRKMTRKRLKYAISEDKETDFVKAYSTLFMETDDITIPFCKYVKKVSAQGFDVVQVEFFEYLPLVYMLPHDTKKVFVHHELRFIRNQIEMSLFKNLKISETLLYESKKAQEIGALAAFDTIITLTEVDKNILSEYLPSKNIRVSPAITKAVSMKYLTFHPAHELVFVGNSDHFPNVDAMVWFCSEVLPLLEQKMSALPKIHVMGVWRPNIMERLKEIFPIINFTGFVDDLEGFMNGKISIVPIRIASGMRMKILDSIASAAPVITTSKGCEGLPMVNNENCLIADTEEDFANAIVRMLGDVELQETLVKNAQNTDTGMLDDEELFARRLSVYEDLYKHQ